MAPSATTHADDMTQRVVPLKVDKVSKNVVTVTAPASLEIAPPGYYMVFLLDRRGVPSDATGHFIQMMPVAPGSATAVTPTGATVHGTIDDGGERRAPIVRYGLTSTSLRRTARASAAGPLIGAQRVSVTLKGLRPGTTYFYELHEPATAARSAIASFTTPGRGP
jgi:hypothetical protein